MDENIKNSIEIRKSAILNAYDLKDENKKKFDSLFEKIETLGKESKDVADFEDKFAKSSLSAEYNNLFTEIAMSGASLKTVAKSSGTSASTMVAEEIMHETGDRLKSAVTPTRASIHQTAYDKARDIPGVSEALSIKQHVDFFSRFKKKKD